MTSLTQTNSIFSKNSQIFTERFPSLRLRLKEIPNGLIQSAATEDGSYCYVKQLENGQWQTLSLTERPLEAAAKAISSIEARLTAGLGPVIVVGLNPGYVLDIIYQHFEKEYYQKHIPRRIYVIIDSIECLYGWLQKTDRREILKHDEIEFYWHEDVEEIVELCQADETRSHLFMPISTYPEPKTSARMEPLARFFMTRQEQEKKLFRQNRKYYDSISDDELNKIMSGQGSRKPRMLIPSHCSSTVVQYSVRDTAALFEKEGWEVRIMHMKTDLSRWRVNKNINDFKPDVYLLVNHLRTEKLHFYPDNMMFVTWVQDTVSVINCNDGAEAWNKHVNSKEEQRDRIIGYTNQIKQYGYLEGRLEECPMIVNLDIFKPRQLNEDELAKYSCDVCFASNRSTPSHVVADNLVNTLEKYGFSREIMLQINDQLWTHYRNGQTCTRYLELERTICKISAVKEIYSRLENKEDWDFIIQQLFWQLNDLIYRHVVLEWITSVDDLRVHLYGRGWEEHPKFKQYAKGPLPHGDELSKAYSGARINLHLNSLERHHQRINEILACNPNVLTRRKMHHFQEISEQQQQNFVQQINYFTSTGKTGLINYLHEGLFSPHVSQNKVYNSIDDKQLDECISFNSRETLLEKLQSISGSMVVSKTPSHPLIDKIFPRCPSGDKIDELSSLLTSKFHMDLDHIVLSCEIFLKARQDSLSQCHELLEQFNLEKINSNIELLRYSFCHILVKGTLPEIHHKLGSYDDNIYNKEGSVLEPVWSIFISIFSKDELFTKLDTPCQDALLQRPFTVFLYLLELDRGTLSLENQKRYIKLCLIVNDSDKALSFTQSNSCGITKYEQTQIFWNHGYNKEAEKTLAETSLSEVPFSQYHGLAIIYGIFDEYNKGISLLEQIFKEQPSFFEDKKSVTKWMGVLMLLKVYNQQKLFEQVLPIAKFADKAIHDKIALLDKIEWPDELFFNIPKFQFDTEYTVIHD